MRDVEATLRWIEARSQSGAESWHRAYLQSLTRLATAADTFGEALESTAELGIRELSFGTRRGRTFSILFTIRGSKVYIQHVRDSAQLELPPEAFEDAGE
jgi:hypothetical protein